MWIAQNVSAMRQYRSDLPGTVGFVPTMGALHAGHVSLIEQARRLTDHVVVSIFVNPTQFAPHEDFARYPRPIEQDLALCRQAGVTGVFHPPVEEIYPPGQVACELQVPDLAGELEGAARPGHFAGVCRVVAKLFHVVQPHLACFGCKDYQQLVIIRAMAADLAMPMRIVACATVRDADGLALSSRNVYIPADQRGRALGLYKALLEARHRVEVLSESDPSAVEAAMAGILRTHGLHIDYAVLRHPHTLATLHRIEPRRTGGVVALVATRLGTLRLLDNMLLAQPPGS